MRILAAVFALFFVSACSDRSPWGPEVQTVTVEDLRPIAPRGRLTKQAIPLAYDVDLHLDPRESGFAGSVSIIVELETGAPGIWMHGDDLIVEKVSVTVGDEPLVASWTEVLDTGVAWIGFPRRAPAGQIKLDIDYAAPFDANLAGLFRVDEQGNSYALAKSESIQARRFLPSFDEPGFKAPFDMTFTIPEGMIAIANTPEISRKSVDGGFEEVTFATTRPLSTYLLSVAVGNFDKVEQPDIPANDIRDRPIPLTGYARKGKGPELEYALSITPAFVRIFEEALQQPYPYAKLDIVAAPQWPSGATELAGAITYRESRILLNEFSGPAFRRSLKEIHGHEIAHMWFGNLVTPPWWDDLWLKEGFATWGEPMVLTIFEPDEGHDIRAVSEAISAMQLDSLASARAVSEPIERNETIRNAYDAITYRKGMAIIAMADNYFGPRSFRPALGEYIAAFADKDADSADFFEVIGRVTDNTDLTTAFESFVTQTGVPIVSADVACTEEAATVLLEQSRYKPLGSSISGDTLWTIPVCVASKVGDETYRDCMMMAEQFAELPLAHGQCPTWIMPNAGGAGYYRFSLTESGWESLLAELSFLPATEVLQILDSSQASFQAGKMSGRKLRSIVESATQHSEPLVIDAALSGMDWMMGYLPDAESSDAAVAVARQLVKDIRAAQSGFANRELSAWLDAFEATVADEPEARADLMRRVSLFIGTESAPDPRALSSDMYSTALKVAIQDGGATMFDALLKARVEIDDPVFEQAVIRAIGGASEPDLSARVRELALSDAVGARETYTLLSRQMRSGKTREETWKFVTDNFEQIVGKVPSQWRRRLPRFAAGYCDTAKVDEIRRFFESEAEIIAGYERALDETIEEIELCAALFDSKSDELKAAFPTPVVVYE